MAGNLDRSLNDIIKDYGPIRTGSRGSQRSSPYSKTTQVFVGNLPWKTKWMDLKDMCKKFGEVRRADIAEEGGRSKGYGIVLFKTADAAQACIEGLHGQIIDGRDLTVKLDTKPNQSPSVLLTQQRSKFGGSGGGMVFGNHFLQTPFFGNQFLLQNNSSQMRNSQLTPKKAPPGCQVFVGNLPWAVKWQELKDLCKQFGIVERADVAEEGGRSKGYGIVVFDSPISAQACVRSLHGTIVDGRDLTVKFDEKPNQGIAFQSNSAGFSLGGMQFGQHSLTTPMGGGFPSQFGQHSFTSPFTSMGQSVGSGTTVFVGNLPWSVQWQDLKDMCRPFGDVIRADIEENEEGKSKGYGVVKFGNVMSAQNCIANLHGQVYEGRDLTVHLDKFNGIVKAKGPVRVFVGNLPWSFKRWQDLKDLCRNFGDVIRADIEEEEGGRSKGFGIVTFASAIGAQNCINNLNGQLLSGRNLRVRIDQFKDKTNAKSSNKKSNNFNWSDDVPDQESLDAELDNYHKANREGEED